MPTPNLSLEPLEGSQSQKHITVNEAFARLDAAAQLSVIDRWHTDPPSARTDGDRYLVGSPATGGWASHEDQIAIWDEAAQGWIFLTPKEGWRVWIVDERLFLIRASWGWTPLAGSQIGINTTADAYNRLAVASDAVLLTHNGAGIHAKLNKSSKSDTAALLFQTDYSGRAEIGLTGDDDFHVKTSADGMSFQDSMVLEGATGVARLPSGLNLTSDPAHILRPQEWRPNYEPISLTFADAESGGNESPSIPADAVARRVGGEVGLAIRLYNIDTSGLMPSADACLRTLPDWARPLFEVRLTMSTSRFNSSSNAIGLTARIKPDGLISFYQSVDNSSSKIVNVEQFADDVADFIIVGSYPGAEI